MDYNKAKNFGIASLVLGIVGLVCTVTGYGAIFGIIAAIVGIVLGVQARKVLSKEDGKLAFAGLICSIVAVVLDTIALVACVILVGAIGASGMYY